MYEEPHNPDILIGDMKLLDHLATQNMRGTAAHPLQELLEKIIAEELTEDERELFHLRFGEGLSYRDIAKRRGYSSHRTFHVQVNRIQEKVRTAIERATNQSNADSSGE
jgi:RNA polymerase sigma factor (sigma-70 family)